MKAVTFIGENWYMIVAAIALLSCVALGIKSYIMLPSNKKITQVKEWLKIAVDGAEKSIGSGNGEMKLNLVYKWFVKKFPVTSIFISYELFKRLVDEALEKISDVLD